MPGSRRSIGAAWFSHEFAGDVDADQVGFPGGRDTQNLRFIMRMRMEDSVKFGYDFLISMDCMDL